MCQENPAIFCEKQAWLIEKTAEAGYRINKRRLAEWHRAGLLPHPKVVHTTGISGSESVYPLNTLSWLLLLCQVRKNHRSIELVGWNLFLMGVPVDARFWRPALDDGVMWLARYIQNSSEPRETGSKERDILEIGPDRIRKALKKPVSHPFVGEMKKYLGVDRTADFIVHLIDALLGNFENWDRRADEYLESDKRLFSASFAKIPELNIAGIGFGELTADELTHHLTALSELKLGALIPQQYRSMNKGQLLEHARELYIVMGYLSHVIQSAQIAQTSPLNLKKIIPRLSKILSSDRGAIVYLLSLALIEVPSVRNGWKDIVGAIRNAAQNKQLNAEKSIC